MNKETTSSLRERLQLNKKEDEMRNRILWRFKDERAFGWSSHWRKVELAAVCETLMKITVVMIESDVKLHILYTLFDT